jgi:hypothetical protein
MRINPGFRKSVQVELDLNDPHSTDGYVATDFVHQCIQRIGTAFKTGSTQRAWRLTGDYGSGKSAFALALAKAAAGRSKEVPKAFAEEIEGRFDPIVVTGEREPLHVSIGRAIKKQIPSMKRAEVPKDSAQLISMLEKALVESPYGLFLILDELGKNLEFAMMEPQSSDVYTLQKLAEMASRTEKKPFVVLAILHMGFSAYTGELDTTSRQEWNKVSGRFDEILFQHPFEQTIQLFTAAIGLDQKDLPGHLQQEAKTAMRWAVENGLYGNAPAESLQNMAPGIFPIHPTVLPLLMMLFRRFGQNERSLFGFVAGHETGALQEIAALEVKDARFFRLHDLYNYVRNNIAHTITNGRATHWRIIESVARTGETTQETELLKSVGVVNLLDDDSMLVTRPLLSHALGKEERELENTLKRLRERHLLFERGAVRGFALWPHTSVHLDDAFESAKEELGEPQKPMELVASLLSARQVVARKHYIETGNLRHFEIQFHPAEDYPKFLETGPKGKLGDADGHVAIFLPESPRQHHELLVTLFTKGKTPAPNVLVGVTQPPTALLGVAQDLRAWQHVERTVSELASDEFARRELRAQIRNAKEKLNEQSDLLMGWNQSAGRVIWFNEGQEQKIEQDGLSSLLSKIAEDFYKDSPIITNELINRRVTSSAASRARTVLIDAIAKKPEKDLLGMDDSKNPPEMALYLSILKAGKIHVQDETGWKFVTPSKGRWGDPCNLRPSLDAIEKLIKKDDGIRVRVPEIQNALRKAPIGARDGVIPLIIALYLAINSSKTAVYEDGTYLHSLGGEETQRLTKEPEHFELQHCAIEGLKLETYQTIAEVLGISRKKAPEVLDVVRPLIEFITALPEYTRRTKKLSREATEFREKLLTARDPAILIFREVPEALGVRPEDTKELAGKLAKAVGEIKGSYDELLTRLAASIKDAFQTNSEIAEFRRELASRAKAIEKDLVEADIRAFVIRLADTNLDYRNWLESLANHVSKKSANRWTDADEDAFDQRLALLAKRMLRAEAALSDLTRKGLNGDAERALRLALTRPDGKEAAQLVHWTKSEEQKVEELEKQITALIEANGRAGLGAATRALWKHLQKQ